jgi:hypothetical protein
MSEENVAFVEGLLAGATQMDKQELLAALPELIAETCTPDIEWVEDPQRADSRVYHGHEAVRESWERWLEQWEQYGFEAERLTTVARMCSLWPGSTHAESPVGRA